MNAYGVPTTESRLDQISAVVRRQQCQIQELRSEASVLKRILEEVGVFNRSKFDTWLHRMRFERVRQEHPWNCDCELRHVLETREMALAVARNTGTITMGILSCASRLISEVATEVIPCIDEMFPWSIYGCGGLGGTDAQPLQSAERFNPRSEQWEWLPNMSETRWSMACAVVASKLYVCGGSGGGAQRLSTAERFDAATGVWEPLPPMSQARWSAAVAVMSRKLYVCGGLGDGAQPLYTAECFDPNLGIWIALRPMAQGRCSAASAVVRSKLYVCGGSGDGARRLNSTERFDPISGEWTPLPAMSERRSNASSVVVLGKLYVCGGLGDGAHRLKTVERFDPRSGGWEPEQSMHECRSTAAAAVMSGVTGSSLSSSSSGPLRPKLYICGGLGEDGHPLSTCERFDPRTGMWELLSPMLERRWEVSAAVVARKLYVCGGSGSGSARLCTAERFDPISNTWERLSNMLERRSAAAVTTM